MGNFSSLTLLLIVHMKKGGRGSQTTRQRMASPRTVLTGLFLAQVLRLLTIWLTRLISFFGYYVDGMNGLILARHAVSL